MVRVKRHVRSKPRGGVAPVRQYDRGAPITFTAKIGGKTLEYSPRTQEEYESSGPLVDWMNGRAVQAPGVKVADYLKRDKVLQPSLESEFDRLRTILQVEVPLPNTEILINYHTSPENPGSDSRTAEIAGYNDPYRGLDWKIALTPPYTVQNQKEIAAYIRKHEDSILAEVLRLAPRKSRRAGWDVEFYKTHPGLRSRTWTNPVGPYDPKKGGYKTPGFMESAHEEIG